MAGKFFTVFSFVLGTLYLTLSGAYKNKMEEKDFRQINSERICEVPSYNQEAICSSIDKHSVPECKTVDVDLLDGFSRTNQYKKKMLLCKKTMYGFSYIINCASGAHSDALYYRWTWHKNKQRCQNPQRQEVPVTGAAGTSATTQEDDWNPPASQTYLSQRGYISPVKESDRVPLPWLDEPWLAEPELAEPGLAEIWWPD